MQFSSVSLSDLNRADLDALPFGVVRIDGEGRVTAYNQQESRISGLSPDRVMGRHFFTEVAPCMNNYLVAQRLEAEGELDHTLDYVFTLKMVPTPVRLRLLRAAADPDRALLVELA